MRSIVAVMVSSLMAPIATRAHVNGCPAYIPPTVLDPTVHPFFLASARWTLSADDNTIAVGDPNYRVQAGAVPGPHLRVSSGGRMGTGIDHRRHRIHLQHTVVSASAAPRS